MLEQVGADNDPGFIEAWYMHIMGEELPKGSEKQEWYRATLSPAYLKELFLLSKLNNQSLAQAWETLHKRKRLIESKFEDQRGIGFLG